MNTIKTIWNSYRSKINQNCTDDLVANTSLAYWQNRLFASSIIYLIPLSLIAIIPGIYMAYITDLQFLILVDMLAICTILSVAFIPGFSVHIRKLLFNSILYLTSFTLLIYLGSFGPGLLYLLGITIFIVLSLDKKYGYVAIALNTLICIVIGLLLHLNVGNFEILYQYGLDTWIAVSTNLIFLSAVSVLLIPILFEGLQSSIIQENNLRTELEFEKDRLKETVHELHQRNKELEEFSYTISHDLKEPLRMIRSFMELLERRYKDKLDEKAQLYINYATDGAQRMSKSIDDLLEYSRVGRLYTELESVDISAIVEDIISRVISSESEIKAKIDYENLPTVRGIPITLNILFQNLITNAIKYQPDGQEPEITICAKEHDNCWEFAVRDNGIGIDYEYFEQIFGLFKRLHTREDYPGNGMGLAICKKIVEQHGGEIWVESENGKGSIFYFTIQK